MKTCKRVISSILAIVLLISATPTCFARAVDPDPTIEPLYTYDEMLVTVFNANVRSEPSTTSTLICTLPRGTTVWYISSVREFKYINMGQVGDNGYIREDLLCSKASCYYVNPQAGLKLRETEAGAIIGTLSSGTLVDVIEAGEGNWVLVRVLEGTYEGEYGYVSSDYLRHYEGV